MTGTVSRRYAKALFAVAKENDALETTAAHLTRLAATAADPAMQTVLANPLLTAENRHTVAATLARQLQVSNLVTRFLGLLADHQRLRELAGIAEHFAERLDEEFGRAPATIRTAQPLQPQQEAELVTVFSRLSGKQIVPHVVVDPDLLGGVLVEVAGKIYDGSVRTQLARLAKQLTGNAAV